MGLLFEDPFVQSWRSRASQIAVREGCGSCSCGMRVSDFKAGNLSIGATGDGLA